MKQRVFISNAIDEEKLPFFYTEGMKFGKAHYSWKIIASLYQRGLEEAGLEVSKVTRPEIYQTIIAQKTFGVRNNDLHIAAKPIEHIRQFYGMKNIFIGGWEFPEFSDMAYDGNPLFDHISILKHADQIWCWSDFTTNNLRSYGVNTAITMPPPVIVLKNHDELSIQGIAALPLNTERVPVSEDIKPLSVFLEKYNGDTVFLSVLNPFDKRKQLKLMLSAFLAALKINSKMVLVIKLAIDNELTTLCNIQEILSVHHEFHGQSDRVIFLSEALTDSQMVKLSQVADFYLCTSSTEGLNLPMIEAMAQGVVPISSNATAMADYIHKDNAVVIEYDEKITDDAYHFLHKYLPTTHFPPRFQSIVEALTLAVGMKDDVYHILSNRAKSDVYAKYSVQAFVGKLNEIGVVQL